MNSGFWKNRNVFLTGHTGFKGGWTALWLSSMGEKVYGYSLAPSTRPSFFVATKLEKQLSQSTFANILDLKNIVQAMKTAKPQFITERSERDSNHPMLSKDFLGIDAS